jgi:hypothetical protein
VGPARCWQCERGRQTLNRRVPCRGLLRWIVSSCRSIFRLLLDALTYAAVVAQQAKASLCYCMCWSRCRTAWTLPLAMAGHVIRVRLDETTGGVGVLAQGDASTGGISAPGGLPADSILDSAQTLL